LSSNERLLVKNGFVITCDDNDSVFENGFVGVQEKKIIEVGPTNRMKSRSSSYDVVIDAKNHVVMPGLVSLHFHSDNLTRGIGEHMGLSEWLDTIYYPTLAALKPRHVKAAASLAYLEAIKSGTTCVNDMYRHVIACSEAAEQSGIRAVISGEGADLVEGQETLKDNEAAFLARNDAANGRIRVWFGVEWIPVCSPEFLRSARALAEKHKTGIHIHLNESSEEVKICKKKYGVPPIKHAQKLGVLGPDVVAAHCVWLDDQEIGILRKTGTHVSHNPVSNMKLGNGFARVPEMIDQGINVGLGPDDAPCNNTVDMFEVMKFASLAHKARLLDASKMPSEQILLMATRNGARALGLDKTIGSIERGKKADLITLNLRTPRLTPVILGRFCNIFANLVYAAHGEDVDNSIIDGRLVMRDRKVTTLDEERVISEAGKCSRELMSMVLERNEPAPTQTPA
jgi:5-methylthioadenosine/S-adenosylhomocysteine deaminase